MPGYLLLPDGRMVEARDGLVLGRDAACDIVVHDRKASRRHATLHVAGSVVEIEDLDSSNGTLLNGKRVQRRLLRDNDRIQIGTWAITYREQAASAAPAPPPADELVFDDEGATASAPRPAPAAPPPARTPPAPPPPPAAEPPRAAPAAGETLEFLDEVVQVRTPPPAAREKVAGRPRAPERPAPGRVLQFHKRPDRGGVLGEDLGQMSSAQRLGLVLLALAVAALIGWVALQLAR